MHGHDSTDDAPRDEPSQPTMNAAFDPAEGELRAPAESTGAADASESRSSRSPIDVRAFSVSGFRRRFKSKAEAEHAEDPVSESRSPADESRRPKVRVGRSLPTIPHVKVDWGKLPMARAKRETRVGAAALVSFAILVTILIVHRGL